MAVFKTYSEKKSIIFIPFSYITLISSGISNLVCDKQIYSRSHNSSFHMTEFIIEIFISNKYYRTRIISDIQITVNKPFLYL